VERAVNDRFYAIESISFIFLSYLGLRFLVVLSYALLNMVQSILEMVN